MIRTRRSVSAFSDGPKKSMQRFLHGFPLRKTTSNPVSIAPRSVRSTASKHRLTIVRSVLLLLS